LGGVGVGGVGVLWWGVYVRVARGG